MAQLSGVFYDVNGGLAVAGRFRFDDGIEARAWIAISEKDLPPRCESDPRRRRPRQSRQTWLSEQPGSPSSKIFAANLIGPAARCNQP